MTKKKKYLVVALSAALLLAATVYMYCLNSSRWKLMKHFGVSILVPVENLKYARSEWQGFSSHYFTFDIVDSTALKQMQNCLSLKQSDRLPVTHDNGGFPRWWPDELLQREGWDEFRQRITKLHQNGDLITYSASINKQCLVVVYHFPKNDRVYCQEWWHEVYVPSIGDSQAELLELCGGVWEVGSDPEYGPFPCLLAADAMFAATELFVGGDTRIRI